MDKMNFKQSAACNMVRARGNADDLQPRGRFDVEHIRNGKVIGKYTIPNTITNEGKNKLFDVMFHGVAAIATWYVGLVDGIEAHVLAAGDTHAGINTTNGWTEFTDYEREDNNALLRVEWPEGDAASQTITNATPMIFDIVTVTAHAVYGLFVAGGTGANTKADATAAATLWAAAAFTSGEVSVSVGDQLKVTYTVTA
jgi:hypothetical protein